MTEYEPQWREVARAKISPPRLRNPFVGWPRAAVLAQWKSEPGWFLEIRDEHDNEMTSDRRFDTRTEAEAAAREEWGKYLGDWVESGP